MDINRFCRTCAQPNMAPSNSKDIFRTPKLSGVLEHLQEWQLDIAEKDGLSQQLCEECENMLLKIDEFRRTALEAKEILELLHEQEMTNDTETDNEIAPKMEDDFAMEFLVIDEFDMANVERIEIERVQQVQSPDQQVSEPAEVSLLSSVNEAGDVSNSSDRDSDDWQNIRYVRKEKIKQPERSFKNRCTFCVYTDIMENIDFDSPEELKAHVDQVHFDPLRLYNCGYCPDKYQTRTGCMLHINAKHSGKRVHCNICNKIVYGYQGKLELHMAHVHTLKDRKCPQCDEEFPQTSLINMEKHLLWHKNGKHRKCKQCDKSFINTAELRAHTRTHPKKKCLCTHCGQCERDTWHLRAHQYCMHGIGEPPVICKYCPKTFRNHASRRLHILKNHPEEISERTFECSICHKKFETRLNLERHLKYPHKSNDGTQDEKPYECTICNMKFKYKPTMLRHKEKHINVQHNCESCGKVYARAQQLSTHIARVHPTLSKKFLRSSAQALAKTTKEGMK